MGGRGLKRKLALAVPGEALQAPGCRNEGDLTKLLEGEPGGRIGPSRGLSFYTG